MSVHVHLVFSAQKPPLLSESDNGSARRRSEFRGYFLPSMLFKIRATTPRRNVARNSGSPNLDAKTRPLGLVAVIYVSFHPSVGLSGIKLFLSETERPPSLRSLELFGCLQPNIHLGLVFYNGMCAGCFSQISDLCTMSELHDIEFYWDSLTPVEKAISKRRFVRTWP
jgi:hypothetical protein